MKHRIITAVIIAAIAACLLCGSASAMSGSGTLSNPYIISSQADLALLSGSNYASYAGNDKYFELGADITMSGTFTSIGTNSYKFNGHFDGKGHRITGLKTNSDPTGLFMYVTSGAEIKNINFYNAEITGTGGGGAGVLYGVGYQATYLVTVSNVNVYDSKVTSVSYCVGGISGMASYQSSKVKITNCNVERSVLTNSAGSCVAGISADAAHNSATCEVIGCNVNDCIISCYAGNCVGGIFGFGSTTSSIVIVEGCKVENCYIYGNEDVGGFVGAGTQLTETSCTITDCHVLKSTIRAARKYAGGVYGFYASNGGRPTVTGCTVTDCTIIAVSYGGGITGGYSS